MATHGAGNGSSQGLVDLVGLPFKEGELRLQLTGAGESWLLVAGNCILAQLDLQLLRRTSRIASGRSSFIHFGQLDKTQLSGSENKRRKQKLHF